MVWLTHNRLYVPPASTKWAKNQLHALQYKREAFLKMELHRCVGAILTGCPFLTLASNPYVVATAGLEHATAAHSRRETVNELLTRVDETSPRQYVEVRDQPQRMTSLLVEDWFSGR